MPEYCHKLLSIENMSLIIDGQTILEKISLDVVSNKIITLIGPNGAGKSSLAKVILGLYKPTSGKVSKKDNLRVGYVPQNFTVDQLIPITVHRFLQIYTTSSSAIAHAVSLLGVDKLLPRRLQTLSGGERQKVLLAQSLLCSPELLVLDEPSQGMDITAQAEFYRLIKLVKEELGCAVVMISHDLHFVMAGTDHVVCLNKHLCCHGDPKHVKSDPAFKKIFGDLNPESELYVHIHDHVHHADGGVTDHDK